VESQASVWSGTTLGYSVDVVGMMITVRGFEELVAEAAVVDVSGWGFGWLEGRATEERPPWGYARLMAERLAGAQAAMDVDTGGGEVLAEVPVFPPRMCATEGWAPNRERARRLLSPRGVQVVAASPEQLLPFADASFDLVTSRHPVVPRWTEIARVLTDGGTYLAQHVGPASAFELIESFLGPLPDHRAARHPVGGGRRRAGGRSAGRRPAEGTMPDGVPRHRRDRLHPAQVHLVGARLHFRTLPGHPGPA
jgi:SAM-dependent methyltransferase